MMSLAVVVVVKATLVCGGALLFSHLCRRTRASIRHVVLVLAFVALVVIPGAGSAVPSLAVTVPAAITSSVERTQPIVSVSQAEGSGTAPITRNATVERSVTATQVLTVIWLTGVALFMTPVVAGFWQVSRLRMRALPWTERQELVQTLSSSLGLRRRIDAVIHDTVPGPMTCGILRPCIFVPASARHWDEATLRRALRHEIEHVARWDFLINCAARVVCAAYWFHPWVWAAWRRLRLDAERACDDAVVQEDDAREYAALLVAMAQGKAAGTRPLLAMAGRDDLAARVAALLDHQQTRGRVGRRRAAALTIAGAIAMLAVASVTVARAMPQAQVAAAAPSQTFAAASIKRNPLQQIRFVDGQMVATNVTVRELLIAAFGVRDIDSGPGWVNGYRFDIVAKMPSDNQGPERGSKSLQAFLAERFKLVAHRGSKDSPIYALVQARPGGSLGPRMTVSQRDCRTDTTCGMSSSDGRLAGRGITLAEFTRNLRAHLGDVPGGRQFFDRELMDRTGLSGRFDFTLQWTPDATTPSPADAGQPSQFRPFASVLDSNAPRFLAALEEQLGLTIESQLAPKPVLVIDSIEEPAGN
jgi:bla regulator protein blaR1